MPKSEHAAAVCREYAFALAEVKAILNPGGFAHSIHRSGESDADIAEWLKAGKTFTARKRKAVIPG